MSHFYKILSFNKKFDYIICLNGILPKNDFFEIVKEIEIVAADGAANQLFEMDVNPDIIIGDMDSINEVKFGHNDKQVQIIKIDDQDTNDFEKILIWCNKNGRTNLLITGIHGGDMEHTLNNWSVFSRYSKIMNLCIYENNRYGISISHSFEYQSYKGELLSLIPQTSSKISSENLKWELLSDELIFGNREGARNMSISDKIRLEIISGSILFFFDSKLPLCPNFL